MSQYKRAQLMHQYYRDALIQRFNFDDVGTLPKEWILTFLDSKTCDTLAVAEQIRMMNSGLPENEDSALKEMLLLIAHSNMAMDQYRAGLQTPMPLGFKNVIRDGVMRVLAKVPSISYLINCIQILYRVGLIDETMSLIDQNPRVLEASPALQRIAAMVYLIEGRYEDALPHLLKLVESGPEGQLPLVKLMSMSCLYALGGQPDEPVDFASLNREETSKNSYTSPTLNWVIPIIKKGRNKPTVVIACDEKYFFEHALALLYSIHDQNGGELCVHFHLYNPNPSMVRFLASLGQQYPELEISATSETIEALGDPKGPNAATSKVIQFATRRFIAADALLGQINAPLILIDADALWKKNWNTLFGEASKQVDVIACKPEVSPSWEKILAGFLYIKPTENGKNYLREVAAFIDHNLSKGKFVWFLDQIALSACYDRFLEPSPHAALAAKPSRIMDFSHGEDALTWVVTNQKAGAGEYAEYKNQIQAKYGQMPYSGPNDAFRYISELNVETDSESTLESKRTVYFLQVGAMDGQSYDPIYPFVRAYGWNGVLVEPLPDMIERLRANYEGSEGLVFENVAITEQVETKKLYRVTLENIVKHKLPDWLKGMSTFSDTKLKDYKKYVTIQPVSCMPLMDLIERNMMPRIDVFQIDTEGYDYKVFKQLDFTAYRPSIINLEVINLQPAEIEAIQSTLDEQGYVYYRYEFDLIAFEPEFFKKQA
jgi:FkbM family methyltransferase